MNSIPVYINALHPISFGYDVDQEKGLRWIQNAIKITNGDIRAANFYERLKKGHHIDKRRTCLQDFSHENWEEMLLFKPKQGCRPGLDERMKYFATYAENVVWQAFCKEHQPPDYLVQVSCTGYESPSACQKILIRKMWHNTTKLLSIGHMGCYAALPIMNMVRRMLNSNHRWQISCMLFEFCSLHLDIATVDTAKMITHSLFSDGAIRIDFSASPGKRGFEILGYFEYIIPDTLNFMTWRLTNTHFSMTLSPNVPLQIAAALERNVQNFLENYSLSLSDVDYFALHPGGIHILNGICEALCIARDKTIHSYEIFRMRGNMSSTTLPHIWHAIMVDSSVQSGQTIMSLAFGPGLTVVGSLMKKV